MAKKTTSAGNAFDHAAHKLQVPVAALKLWLVDAAGASPSQWTMWKNGQRPISPKMVDDFLEWRRAAGNADWPEGEWLRQYLAWLDQQKIAQG